MAHGGHLPRRASHERRFCVEERERHLVSLARSERNPLEHRAPRSGVIVDALDQEIDALGRGRDALAAKELNADREQPVESNQDGCACMRRSRRGVEGLRTRRAQPYQPPANSADTMIASRCATDDDRHATGMTAPRLKREIAMAMTSHSDPRVRSVLIVEDDPTISTALVGLLEDENFEVMTASDLRRARYVLFESRHPVGVLVLDLALPDGNGEDLLAEMSQRAVAPPTVLVSAIAERAERAAVAFGLPHAPKPFDLTLVAASVVVAFDNDLRPRGPLGADVPRRTPSTLKLPRFGGRFDYATSRRTSLFSSNSIGLT